MLENATLNAGTFSMRTCLEELSGVGSRQVAAGGRLASRLYAAWTDRVCPFPDGTTIWVQMDSGERYVAYLIINKGRSLRLLRRDGEFLPGIVLKKIGVYERGTPAFVLAGDGYYVCIDGSGGYYTRDFNAWTDVPDLRGCLVTASLMVNDEVVLGTSGRLLHSPDGTTWDETALGLQADVMALGWDGAAVWAATTDGICRVDWATRTAARTLEGFWLAISEDFGNPTPYFGSLGTEGVDVVRPDGALYRQLSQDCWPTDNLVQNGTGDNGPIFLTMDFAGHLHRFDGATDDVAEAVELGVGFNLPQMHRLRGYVMITLCGRLYWTDGARVVLVRDFGQDVGMCPGRYGPTIITAEGTLYQVKRVDVV